jgi:streptogramin lyase
VRKLLGLFLVTTLIASSFLVISIPTSSAGTSSIFASTGGALPTAITIDSAGNLYVANENSNSVSKITPLGFSTIFASTGTRPRGIAIDSSGNVYTANYGSNNVTKISAEGVVLNTFDTGVGPVGITVDSSGNIYTANYGSYSATKLNSSGNVVYTASTDWGPWGITVDSDGNAYTSNSNEGTITKIDVHGNPSKCADAYFPRGITIDSSGNLYVANGVTKTATKIAAGCGTKTEYGSPGNYYGITLDSAGNIYTVNSTSKAVIKITPTGDLWNIGSFASTTNYGIAINTAGNIFVTNGSTNAITKIVQYPAPAFTLSSTVETSTAGVPISGYSITSTGGTVVRYAIAPAIGNGLSFSTSTGRITGTPTSGASLVTYTVTGSNENGSASATFGITVTALSPPAFTLTSTDETVTAGSSITGFTINSTGGVIASYSITPAIGNGLSFSTATGLITGTPGSQASRVSYTITGTNASGSASATFALTVNSAAPPSNDSGPPPPPPPPKSYLLQSNAPTLRKVGSALVCLPGSYSFRIQYFDGTREFFETNTRLSSRTYSFLIDGRIESALTSSYGEDSATVSLALFPARGTVSCLVVAIKNGVSITGYSTENWTGLSAASSDRSLRVSSAAIKYQAALVRNAQKVQIGLRDNREKWRSAVATAQSIFASSRHKATDARAQVKAIQDAKKAYLDGKVSIPAQLEVDNALALKTKLEEETAADAAYYAAQEAAGYGVRLG